MPQANFYIRRSSGNMLTMTALYAALIILACAIAFGFYMMVSQYNKGQAATDKEAMELGKVLNERDRVGQMNNVIAESRALVFVSRQAQNTVEQRNLYRWRYLANRLTEEARAGALLVEEERKNQIEMSQTAIRRLSEKYNKNSNTGAVLSLPWWKTYDAQIYEVSCGYIDKVPCNVLHPEAIPALTAFDEQEKYYDLKSNLYNGNINAKLPAPDSDLDFKLCSLSAPVEDTVAPCRLVNSQVFKPTALLMSDQEFQGAKNPDQIQSAIKVVTRMNVQMDKSTEAMGIASYAAAPGANSPP